MKYIWLVLVVGLIGCNKQHDYFSVKELFEKLKTDPNYVWHMKTPKTQPADYNVFFDVDDFTHVTYETIGGTTISNEALYCKGARHDTIYDLRFTEFQDILECEYIHGFAVNMKLKMWGDTRDVRWFKDTTSIVSSL